MGTLHLLVTWLLLLGTTAAAREEPARFVRIKDPGAGEEVTGVVFSISPDGRFVGGAYRPGPVSDMQAFRWSEAKGLEYLGVLPGAPYPFSVTDALSLNGEVAVGSAVSCGGVAFMWRDGKMWELPRPPDAECLAFADDITPDARIVVGTTSSDPFYNFGVVWENGVPRRLVSDRPDISVGVLWKVTPDGTTIVGLGRTEAGARSEAMLYRKGHVTRIGVLPGAPRGTAFGVSDDGRLAVGSSFSQGFIWSEKTGMVNISGDAPPGTSEFDTFAISADGRIVSGMVRFEGRQQAAVWTAHTGTRLMMTILAEAGVDLQGTTHILNADYMSADGLKYGCRVWRLPEPLTYPFYAVIPPFCFADCDNSGTVDFADLLCFLNRFERAQDPRANPIDFFYCDLAADDEIDFNDFLAFLNLYNKGCGE